MRRTKIVATMGPATDTPKDVEAIVAAGVDVVRMNFSHGNPDEHRHRAKMVREAANKVGRTVGILGDLQGPKIRIERFAEGVIELAEGDAFVLDADLERNGGNQERVGLTYKTLVEDVESDDILLLDDGRIVLKVDAIEGNEIHTTVVNGGKLSNNKGINRQGGGLSAAALTEKDKEDIKLAAEIGVDFLAVSFPRCGEDLNLARKLMKEAGGNAQIVAKMERAEAMDAAEDIIIASDVIMVARGDLGVEIGDTELPSAQKRLISMARKLNRVVITATQMMESMIENPIPTRAEVFDVANAVLDGTDAVMLSGETATGRHPAKVVAAMSAICEAAEQQPRAKKSDHRIDMVFERVDEAVAMATMYTANHMNAKAIASLTESGATPLWMSRISSGIPIYALTRHEETSRKVSLYRGVYPQAFKCIQTDIAKCNQAVIDLLLEDGIVEKGDIVIITKGDLMGELGGTNSMKIIRVGDAIAGCT